jgi:hypothetical protein
MADRNVERVHRYHAALNAIDLEAVAAMFAEQGEYHSPSIGGLIGKPAVMAAMRSYFAEYPDQHAVDDMVEALDATRVRSRWRLTATEKTTGKAYVRSGAEVITFSPEGLILRVEVEDM